MSFRSLQVDEAHLVLPSEHPGDPWTRLIDARLLQYGDVFKVPPETRIVTDGKVMHGGSEVDESMITGEPLPVAKAKGSLVQAGTNNGRGTIIVTLTKLPHENTISNIATLVENAELTKPKAQAIADRIATWFVPVITVIALSVFIIWITVQRYVTVPHMPLWIPHTKISMLTSFSFKVLSPLRYWFCGYHCLHLRNSHLCCLVSLRYRSSCPDGSTNSQWCGGAFRHHFQRSPEAGNGAKGDRRCFRQNRNSDYWQSSCDVSITENSQ